MLCLFFLGFSSGLPLLLIGSTYKAWMTEAGVSLAAVGAIALIQIPYSIKFLWAPFMDRYTLPFLDRRRGWIAVSQVLLAISLFALAQMNPDPTTVIPLLVVVAFLSASQDISIDAYRRDVLKNEEQGLGASFAVNGYRIGLLLAGAGALGIAQYWSWEAAYQVMAGAMLVSVIFTFLSPSVAGTASPPQSLRAAVIEPFIEFFSRSGSVEILVFILLFKIGDQMASDMFNPFYLMVGYEKIQIAAISKVFGLWATIAGGLAGGVLLLRFSLYKCLWVFGILQAVSTLSYSWLATVPPTMTGLAFAVSFENFCGGLGTAAFVAFMASLTNRRFTATQYALLSSLMSVPRVFFGAWSGVLAEQMGWVLYFAFCAAIAIPGLLMLRRFHRWSTPE